MDDKGQVAGGIAFNIETYEYYVISAKATILATGGSGRLHLANYPTTNHYGATGDGLVMAYHVGANLLDLDTIQIHPTGDAYPEPLVGVLSTEKIRGLGARPINKNGNTFVFPLEPRDVESASFIRECKQGKGIVTPTGMPGIWLDSPMIDIIHGSGTIEKKLAGEVRKFKRFGVDMTKHPILVYPTLHYQNGGVEITGYGGPCPPIGRHRYFHKLYALDVVLPDLGEPAKANLERAMQGLILGHAELIGTYQKRR